MAMLKMFSIWDRAAGEFAPPYPAPNAALAVRLFQQTQLDTSHVFATHSKDFQVHELGEYDTQTAEWIPLTKPLPLLTPEINNGQD
jgi:hypothetical protein